MTSIRASCFEVSGLTGAPLADLRSLSFLFFSTEVVPNDSGLERSLVVLLIFLFHLKVLQISMCMFGFKEIASHRNEDEMLRRCNLCFQVGFSFSAL